MRDTGIDQRESVAAPRTQDQANQQLRLQAAQSTVASNAAQADDEFAAAGLGSSEKARAVRAGISDTARLDWLEKQADKYHRGQYVTDVHVRIHGNAPSTPQ